MEHGTHCKLASCNRLSFLPISCPFCTTSFCEAHYLPQQHTCPRTPKDVLTPQELAQRVLHAQTAQQGGGSGGMSRRLPCQRKGCKAFSLQVQGATESNGKVEFRAPLCQRCAGLFCPSHASPTAHGCTSPAPLTEGQQRMAAAEERKRKAREVLAKNFPNRNAK